MPPSTSRISSADPGQADPRGVLGNHESPTLSLQPGACPYRLGGKQGFGAGDLMSSRALLRPVGSEPTIVSGSGLNARIELWAAVAASARLTVRSQAPWRFTRPPCLKAHLPHATD